MFCKSAQPANINLPRRYYALRYRGKRYSGLTGPESRRQADSSSGKSGNARMTNSYSRKPFPYSRKPFPYSRKPFPYSRKALTGSSKALTGARTSHRFVWRTWTEARTGWQGHRTVKRCAPGSPAAVNRSSARHTRQLLPALVSSQGAEKWQQRKDGRGM
jgi:hypothetical protein